VISIPDPPSYNSDHLIRLHNPGKTRKRPGSTVVVRSDIDTAFNDYDKSSIAKVQKLKGSRYPIVIRLTQNKKVKYIFTGYSALEREWSGKYG
jgi:hypothetical protein